MKRHLFPITAVVCFLLSGSWAIADEAEDVRQEVLRRIEIKSTKLESSALKKVSGATFYKVTVKIKEGDGSSTSKMLLVRKGDKFVDLETTFTSKDMPGFKGLISKSFKLKTEADAKVFEEALDSLYPLSKFGSSKKAKAIKKTPAGWAFIRGTFFKDLKGFEVATDANGTVQSIGYNLKIKK